MIYTLTLNPAIDYVVKTTNFSPGELNRLDDEQVYFGGKGINVSRILKELGMNTVALGFVAGFTGDAIKDGVEAMGINTDFVVLKDGNTRINVKIKAETETELNGRGPRVGNAEKEALFEKLRTLKDGDMLVLSGSVPAGLGSNVYEEIMESLSGKKIDIIVDTTGESLLNSLKQKPFLIKPNKEELEQIFERKLNTDDEIVSCAKELCKLGAKRVLVSMGAQGAVYIDADESVYKVTAPNGKALNTVGAGDSMVAGFLAGYSSGKDIGETLKTASAAGSATAFSDDLATKEAVMNLLDKISVEEIG